jgi:sensor histidine kinase YesM
MPTTLEATIILLIFAIPAYLTLAVYRARYPVHYYREKQSPIEQAVSYVFLGAVVNILILFTLGLLWLLAALLRSLLPVRLLQALAISGTSLGELILVAFLLAVIYFTTVIVFSFIIGNVIVRLIPREVPLWIEELKRLKAIQAKVDTGIAWILVHLKNGDRCLGLVSEFRWIGDEGNTMELTLEKAYYQLVDNKEKENVGRVLLRSDDILWLSPYSG